MNPKLREKIAQFLEQQGVFIKEAISSRAVGSAGESLGGLLAKHRGKIGLIGGLAGGGGTAAGVAALGKEELQNQQEAAELNQLLEAYPELLYTTPTTPYTPPQ